jgi:hypothetical protein
MRAIRRRLKKMNIARMAASHRGLDPRRREFQGSGQGSPARYVNRVSDSVPEPYPSSPDS